MSGRLRGWWLRVEPAFVRDRLSDVNDGILSIAGTSLGLAGAEIGPLTSFTVLAIAAVVGTLSVLSVQLNEELNAHEAEVDAAEHEQQRLALDPDGEIQELVDWFQEKGVSPETSLQVAEELSAADALDIQLALEYGIEDVTTLPQALGRAFAAAAAFLLGAALPILLQLALPLDFRSWLTMTIAGVSLTITALVLSPRGHYNVVMAVIRGLILGLGMLALTYWIGDALM